MNDIVNAFETHFRFKFDKIYTDDLDSGIEQFEFAKLADGGFRIQFQLGTYPYNEASAEACINNFEKVMEYFDENKITYIRSEDYGGMGHRIHYLEVKKAHISKLAGLLGFDPTSARGGCVGSSAKVYVVGSGEPFLDNFKQTYEAVYQSTLVSNPNSDMRRALNNGAITSAQQIDSYAAANPKSRTAKVKALLDDYKASVSRGDEVDNFSYFKSLYEASYSCAMFKNPLSAMRRGLKDGSISTIEQVNEYAKKYPNSRTGLLARTLGLGN